MFYGPYEIKSEVEVGTTEGGDTLIELTFKDSTEKRLVSRKGLEEAQTEERSDLDQLRDNQYQPLIKRLTEEICENGPMMQDISWICQKLGENCLNHFDVAAAGKMGRTFTPGLDLYAGMNLLDAVKMIKDVESENKTEDDAGASDGGGTPSEDKE